MVSLKHASIFACTATHLYNSHHPQDTHMEHLAVSQWQDTVSHLTFQEVSVLLLFYTQVSNHQPLGAS